MSGISIIWGKRAKMSPVEIYTIIYSFALYTLAKVDHQFPFSVVLDMVKKGYIPILYHQPCNAEINIHIDEVDDKIVVKLVCSKCGKVLYKREFQIVKVDVTSKPKREG